jgi:hypothetical protein
MTSKKQRKYGKFTKQIVIYVPEIKMISENGEQ